MATVNVRQLDENVVRRLKRRAEANNRSLESEVRHILAGRAEEYLDVLTDSGTRWTTTPRKSFLGVAFI